MAKYEANLRGNIEQFMNGLETYIARNSSSNHLEVKSDETLQLLCVIVIWERIELV